MSTFTIKNLVVLEQLQVLSALIGDENDKYRPVKIALLAAGVVGVSGGIAYYLFVKVK